MSLNIYFQNENRFNLENQLLDDLIIESIQIHGQDVFYITRENVNEIEVFGEDPSQKFVKAIQIEMYPEDFEGFQGDRDILGKFGVEVRDEITFSVSRKRFIDVLGLSANITEPREGDLIFFPLPNALFEIKFVQDDTLNFFQIEKKHIFSILCERFRFSNEKFETGDVVIDSIEKDFNNAIDIQLDQGVIGIFRENEIVFQGPDLVNATAKAEAVFYDKNTRILRVINIINEILPGQSITGVDSAAVGLVMDANDQSLPTIKFADNKVIEVRAQDIINFDENNPFSEEPTF